MSEERFCIKLSRQTKKQWSSYLFSSRKTQRSIQTNNEGNVSTETWHNV